MSAAKKLNSPLSEAKRQGLKHRCSIGSVKDAIRKEFRDRLSQLRNESLNNRRNLTPNTANSPHIFRNNLVIDSPELTSADILQILEEVEQEFQMEQCEEYERDNDSIIEHLLQQLNFCPACDKIVEISGSICRSCSEGFSSL